MVHQFTNALVAKTILSNASQVCADDRAATLAGLARRVGNVETSNTNAIVANTGKFTGRSPKDKYIVRDATTEHTVWWDNAGSMTPEHFETLLSDILEQMDGKRIMHQRLFAGANLESRYDVDVFTPSPWHALFIRHLLIRPTEQELKGHEGNVTIVHLPDFEADPERHGTKTETCVALDFTRNIVVICGTQYAGEIKKSVFSLFNFHAPAKDILPMHCSANLGQNGDTTLFFGLSGTGKTTLSTAPDRKLIGDDEHGWSENGIFNLEGGCYAKAVNLSAEGEPEIYAAAQQPDVVMENVILKDNGEPDYTDISLTENTRIAYPLDMIANREDSGVGPVPTNIVLLTADAFGVLPPIARLSVEQAIYYFLSGYTAKVAGTERGVTEPQATFSACFGAPFMARHPSDYGALLGKRLEGNNINCWLLNTGWTGGGYGVGERMSLKDTRLMLETALSGGLDDVEFEADPYFGLSIPTAIDGIDTKLLSPSKCWDDQEAYKQTADKLLGLFDANMEKLGIDLSRIVPQSELNSSAA